MLDIVIEARSASIAPGMDVRRILPFRSRRMVGPFIFMDHGGPVQIDPSRQQNLDVLPHPHIGLSTVSYLLGGKVTHRDSLGVEQVIEPGEVNRMTAGKGIAHSERFEDPNVLAAGNFEMLQTWVALPESEEEWEPSFVNYKKDQLRVYTDTGVWMRLIAGDAYGLKSLVKTNSPLFYMHVLLEKGAVTTLPKEYRERAIYMVLGRCLSLRKTATHRFGQTKQPHSCYSAANHSEKGLSGGTSSPRERKGSIRRKLTGRKAGYGYHQQTIMSLFHCRQNI